MENMSPNIAKTYKIVAMYRCIQIFLVGISFSLISASKMDYLLTLYEKRRDDRGEMRKQREEKREETGG
jgi:hypothetical protein